MFPSIPTPSLSVVSLDVDRIYKALSSPLRRQILIWLKDPAEDGFDQALPTELGIAVGQLVTRSGKSQSTISAHLTILEEAGLLTSTRFGQYVLFKRNGWVIDEFLRFQEVRL